VTEGPRPCAGLEAVGDRLTSSSPTGSGATVLLDRPAPGRRDRQRRARADRTTPVPQAEINRILVDRALRGLTVVRFKGGDPYVFGRGGEEVHACRAAGVEVTVVPGITSRSQRARAGRHPVTQRGVATSVHVSSGHVGADAASLAALAPGPPSSTDGGDRRCRTSAPPLVGRGVDADLPVAMVEQGSTARERVTRATVATAAAVAVARACGLRPSWSWARGRCRGLPRRPGVRTSEAATRWTRRPHGASRCSPAASSR
jgi:uroporphyrin-III C-methyltransferase/precorrin-2 dehydrogenase/sirohydrochlorin ferrochelatase